MQRRDIRRWAPQPSSLFRIPWAAECAAPDFFYRVACVPSCRLLVQLAPRAAQKQAQAEEVALQRQRCHLYQRSPRQEVDARL
ncbi:MAG: hypothetical protein EOO41_04900 [Methanobacteriota archaeon]|nr:MAG: hypothetical protein EOO41_04900 [Euryarchaeota archaeon]